MSETAPDATVPRSVGDYTIVRELGAGGMGVVYEAEHEETRRRVALKVVRGGQLVDDGALRLFRREVRALARLEHPGIASLHASGRTPDGLHYFAMELVDGEPLDLWLRRRRDSAMDPGEVRIRLEMFLQIADAVAYAHQRGVLHRDLKPSNLLVTGEHRIKVLDFGLARITDTDVTQATMATEAGMIRGTLAYMSPEQLSGDPEALDVRVDVYALGVVLYELLAGQHPFDLEAVPPFDVARVIRDEPPRSLARAWRGTRRLDADLSTIVAKALEKEPGRRYATVAAMAEDVRRNLSGLPILARAPSAAYQLRKLVSRHKAAAAGIVGVAMLVVSFAVSMAILARDLAEERNRASREAERANAEARAAERAAKVLSELVRFDLSEGLYDHRTLDPKDIQRAMETLEKRWPGNPESQAKLAESVGTSLLYAGLPDAASRFLERAVAIRRDVLHDPDWVRHSRASTLGECYVSCGRIREADAIFAGVLDAARARDDGNALGYALENYGCTRRDLGDYATARRLLDEALAAYLRQKPVWTPWVASVHDSLGTLYLAEGDLDGAEREHRLAFDLRVGYSPTDESATRSRRMLGLVLVRKGRLAEAEPLLTMALQRKEAIGGPSVPAVGEILDAFAELHLAQGRLDAAERDLDRALAIFADGLAPMHPATATAYVHLADLRLRQRRPAEARAALERAVAIREAVFGPGHPDTAAARRALSDPSI